MKIAIIGNGIAGITAARWLRKLDNKVEITVISDEEKDKAAKIAAEKA